MTDDIFSPEANPRKGSCISSGSTEINQYIVANNEDSEPRILLGDSAGIASDL